MMVRGEFATEHDAVVARKLAYILAGGGITAPQSVPEQYVLDLEREAFVSLCGERKTQERIAHTLKTGKPLRNWSSADHWKPHHLRVLYIRHPSTNVLLPGRPNRQDNQNPQAGQGF